MQTQLILVFMPNLNSFDPSLVQALTLLHDARPSSHFPSDMISHTTLVITKFLRLRSSELPLGVDPGVQGVVNN